MKVEIVSAEDKAGIGARMLRSVSDVSRRWVCVGFLEYDRGGD